MRTDGVAHLYQLLTDGIGVVKASDSSRQNKELNDLWGQLKSGKGDVSPGKKRDLKGRELAGDGAYHTLDSQLEELQDRARRQSEMLAGKFGGRSGDPQSGMQKIGEDGADSDTSDEGVVVQQLTEPGAKPAGLESAEDKKIQVR